MVSIHSNKSAVENTSSEQNPNLLNLAPIWGCPRERKERVFSTFFNARRLHGCGCVGLRFATPDIAVYSDAKQVVKQADVLITVTPNEGTLPGNIHGSSVHAGSPKKEGSDVARKFLRPSIHVIDPIGCLKQVSISSSLVVFCWSSSLGLNSLCCCNRLKQFKGNRRKFVNLIF
ncbi:hypothetical protein B9Z55_014159 [Caenorhabditis nigoni]|uniref:Uncharacterized protein n=1 Tax=Caenorhabditis nigoni TaxID=1611254 RepID=A0A2G5U4S7_9PELO|nr:hypothetical protein B9Z55_014159 [Caenorhabditis nigoni]